MTIDSKPVLIKVLYSHPNRQNMDLLIIKIFPKHSIVLRQTKLNIWRMIRYQVCMEHNTHSQDNNHRQIPQIFLKLKIVKLLSKTLIKNIKLKKILYCSYTIHLTVFDNIFKSLIFFRLLL